MSKIFGSRGPVAHSEKMIQKVHLANNGNESPLPSISTAKTKGRHQNRLSRLSSSSSFLLRLMSIEERDDQKKDGGKRGTSKQTSRNSTEARRKFSQDANKPFHHGVYSDQALTDTQDADMFPLEASLDSTQKDSSRYLPLSNNVRPPDNAMSSEEPSPMLPHNQVNKIPYRNQNDNSNLFQSNDNIGDISHLMNHPKNNERPLKLPPLLLPPIHSVRPRPLKERDFLRPTHIRGPINDKEWEDLLHCRYIRHATPRYALKWTPSKSYIQYQ